VQTGTQTRGEIEVDDHFGATRSIRDNDSDVVLLLMALSAPFVDRQIVEIEIAHKTLMMHAKHPLKGVQRMRRIHDKRFQ
jgi:hypothetical protein